MLFRSPILVGGGDPGRDSEAEVCDALSEMMSLAGVLETILGWRVAGRESGWFSTAEGGGVGAALGGASVFGVATTLKVFGPLADVLMVFDAADGVGSGGNADDSIVGLAAGVDAFAGISLAAAAVVGTVMLRMPGVDFLVVAGLETAAAAGVMPGVEAAAFFPAAAIALGPDGTLTS